jgi:restriction endonuclease
VEIHRPHILKHGDSSQTKKTAEDQKKYIPKKYTEFAQGMEQQFAKYMVEQMNKSSGQSQKMDTASSYYKDLLTNEHTKALTETNNGLGIQDLILDDVYPKKFRNEAAFNAYNQHQMKNKLKPRNDITMAGPVQQDSTITNHKRSDVKIGPSLKTGVPHE